MARARQARGATSRGERDQEIQAASNALQDVYHPGYEAACAAAGDRFHAVLLTPYGGWWRKVPTDFIEFVKHSGDEMPDWAIEVERFDHHARTWASWTHSAFMRHAVACAVARGTYKGVRAHVREEAYKQRTGAARASAEYALGESMPCPGG